MHKAIAVIQFKLEGQIIKRRPEFNMSDRLLLNIINYKDGTISHGDKIYKLNDTRFPTIDPSDPYKLLDEEKELIDKLRLSFMNSEKLNNHVRFLFANGSLYLKYNSNLLYHGCIPLNEDGSFKSMKLQGKVYKGRALFDRFEILAREAYFYEDNTDIKSYGEDILWYLWTGENSPVFGKETMATFERYFLDDVQTHKEKKNTYYKLRDSEEVCKSILEEFGLDPNISHIISGHVPVEKKNGESPIKANGKLLVIDGGFSRAYQGKTGLAGYTLIHNSFGLQLVSHQPFESTDNAIKEETDILSSTVVLEQSSTRITVGDTDIGAVLKQQIEDLRSLLLAYRKGLIKEQGKLQA
jgi:fructose-1,6-bisphosphatase-3